MILDFGLGRVLRKFLLNKETECCKPISTFITFPHFFRCETTGKHGNRQAGLWEGSHWFYGYLRILPLVEFTGPVFQFALFWAGDFLQKNNLVLRIPVAGASRCCLAGEWRPGKGYHIERIKTGNARGQPAVADKGFQPAQSTIRGQNRFG